MKKILIILTLAAGLVACENANIEFDDYLYTAGYFPYQYPIRTIILGDYIYPNENDNNHKFLISVAMGGVYENTQNRLFNVELAPALCNNVKFSASGDTIRLMPQSYYTIAASQITIPAGKVNAGVEVQLKDAFFNDTLSTRLWYVIPMRIVNAVNIDTVLQGKSTKTNPDPRVAGDWSVIPKNFTMFAVKFINPYHGKYLHRGVSVVKDATSSTIETTAYRARYAEQNEIWSLVTTSNSTVTVSGSLRSSIITGSLKMDLTFAGNGTCTITQARGSAYTITGSGKFAEDAESWGGSKHDAIFINYQLSSGGNTYSATDTLAIRDRGVVMEVFNPVVFTP
jgi:hypothetical protein